MLPQPKGEYKLPFIAKTSMGTSSTLKIAWWTEIFRTPYEPQYLYLVSDQRIMKGNWAIHLVTKNIVICDEEGSLYGDWKKIEAINNKNCGLLYLDIPLIPQSFVYKYIEKNGEIKEVMIEWIVGHGYEPTKEGPKLDIINEAKLRDDGTVIISKVKTEWNKEELFLVLYECLGDFAHKHNITISGQDLSDWADKKL